MIIACPQCATRYSVMADALNDDGRTVRCSQCQNTWFQRPPAPDLTVSEELAEATAAAEAAEAAGDETGAEEEGGEDLWAGFEQEDVESEAERLIRASQESAAKFRSAAARRRLHLKGWATLAACVGAAVAALVALREPIVRLVPSTAQLYAAANMPVNVRGIEIRNVYYERGMENGIPVLSVKGKLVNISERDRKVPKLRFGLRDAARQELYHWHMTVRKDPLTPQQSTPFVARLASPPPDAREVEVRFARRQELGEYN